MEARSVLGGMLYVTANGETYRDVDCKTKASQNRSSRGGKYYCVTYQETPGKQKREYVHRLVAIAFLPNPNNYSQVNHKDGDGHNNNVDNLEWCTPKQNMAHAYANGLIHKGINAIQCQVCGQNTYSKNKLCASCSKKIKDKERRDKKQEIRCNLLREAEKPVALTSAQKRYARLMLEGMRTTDIARVCGVSRQCVASAIETILNKSKRRDKKLNEFDQTTLGGRMKYQRELKNWTVADVASKLHVSVTTISNWESGKTRPPLYGYAAIAAMFGVTVEYLESGSAGSVLNATTDELLKDDDNAARPV